MHHFLLFLSTSFFRVFVCVDVAVLVDSQPLVNDGYKSFETRKEKKLLFEGKEKTTKETQ